MIRKRVLVVDDAAVVRKLVAAAVEESPHLTVAGMAPNGKIALAKIPHLNPDAIILDIEMDEMGGMEALREIRRLHPQVKVVMFSSHTERGAEATVEALLAGANSCAAKPQGLGGLDEARAYLRRELVARVEELFPSGGQVYAAPKASLRASAPGTLLASAGAPRPQSAPLELLVIASSTGGPTALGELFAALSADFPLPIAVVQHMPPNFTRVFAERLDRLGPIRVREAADGDALRRGQALIAPGDFHLALEDKGGVLTARLNQEPPQNSCRPAADLLFRSAARALGNRVLALVLTGMGEDGLRGCESLYNAGGRILVQDESSAVVWGMPGAVARAGLADAVLPLSRIPAALAAAAGLGQKGLARSAA